MDESPVDTVDLDAAVAEVFGPFGVVHEEARTGQTEGGHLVKGIVIPWWFSDDSESAPIRLKRWREAYPAFHRNTHPRERDRERAFSLSKTFAHMEDTFVKKHLVLLQSACEEHVADGVGATLGEADGAA